MAIVLDPDIFDPGNSNDVYNLMMQNQANNNAFNAGQAERQMNFQLASNAKAMDFEHREAELNRSWQEYMSNTAYQRQVKDMISAGLNPVLGVSNSGATTPSGSMGKGASSSGAAGTADTSINGALSNFVSTLINQATQREVTGMTAGATRYAADTSAAASMFGHQLSSEATRYASELSSSAARYAASASAGAIKYSADRSLEASKYTAKTNAINNQRNIDWQKEYNAKYNLKGIAYDALDWLTSGNKPRPDSLTAKAFDYLDQALWSGRSFQFTLQDGRTVNIETFGKLKNYWNSLSSFSQDTILALLSNLATPYSLAYNP